ncbi:hypothetical protein [Haloarcula laminariae]|uniref:hypothetical protein n=1 Tax=Haloarcula laminariae TaxID=2961577 RepID=UPI0024067825|nr:hypothetical protein [Halomicroarcula sp. FL173]
MGYSRRTVLGLLGASVGLGAVGAARHSSLAQSEVSEQQPTTSEAARQTNGGESGTAGDGTPSALSRRTEDVMDELSWFAGEYDDAIAALRDSADDVLAAVSDHGVTIQLSDTVVERLDGETDRPRLDRGWPYDIWWDEGQRRWRYVDVAWQDPTDEVTDETPLSASAVADIRARTDAFVDTFAAELDPHFSGLAAEESFATATVDTIAEFNRRGDIAMVVAGLVRLYEHYEALSSAAYVDDSLSDDPIRNRLAGYLSAPAPTNTPALFEVEYWGRSGDTHRAFVYGDSVGGARRGELYDGEPLATIDGSTGDAGGIRLQDAVSELSVSADRVDRCYVLVNEWDRPDSGYYSAELTSQPIFVQRYESAAAASDVYERLLDRTDISEAAADVTLGAADPDAWMPLRFPHQGQPWSAVMRQTERHLLVAGVARRPFEQRETEVPSTRWTAPLELSWLWTTTA